MIFVPSRAMTPNRSRAASAPLQHLHEQRFHVGGVPSAKPGDRRAVIRHRVADDEPEPGIAAAQLFDLSARYAPCCCKRRSTAPASSPARTALRQGRRSRRTPQSAAGPSSRRHRQSGEQCHPSAPRPSYQMGRSGCRRSGCRRPSLPPRRLRSGGNGFNLNLSTPEHALENAATYRTRLCNRLFTSR